MLQRLLLFYAIACAQSTSLHSQARVLTVASELREVSITADQLAALPRATVAVNDHGTPAVFEGVELRLVLEEGGAPLGAMRGGDLARYVVAAARDGYRVVFAIAELDPGFNEKKVIVADRRDGKPLSADEGPVRIIVEGEKRMARSARQLERLIVQHAQEK